MGVVRLSEEGRVIVRRRSREDVQGREAGVVGVEAIQAATGLKETTVEPIAAMSVLTPGLLRIPSPYVPA